MKKIITPILQFFVFAVLSVSVLPVRAATRLSLADSLQWHVDVQGTMSDGDHAPLWLTANRHGLSSLENNSAYLRATIERPLSNDDDRRWGVGYGVDLAIAANFTRTVVPQQFFVEGRWLKGVLTLGAKEQPMELKNQELSSGSQALGINARPVPGLRLSLPDYWIIPGTKNWLSLKGHIFYGRTTDDGWQEDFTNKQHRYTKGTWLHTKAGYLKIGPKNIYFEGGLEMATQFGGSSWQWVSEDEWRWMQNRSGLGAFVHAFVPGGSDVFDASYLNTSGNHLGAWMARFTVDQPGWQVAVYGEHFFEDQSSMLQTGYSGYGEGNNWNTRTKKSIFIYDFKDFMLGAELQLKRVPWLSNIVAEYLTTRYQSGAVYHDHTPRSNVQITGRDDYYNHNVFSGWQHWGMVMGNPLYMSPLYNADGRIDVRNNRFRALHLGISGDPLRGLHYRVLATWQRGWGSFTYMYPDPRDNFSLMAEGSYGFADHSPLRGWSIKGALAIDRGEIYGDNSGIQLTISKRGTIIGR